MVSRQEEKEHIPMIPDQERRLVPWTEPEILCSSALHMAKHLLDKRTYYQPLYFFVVIFDALVNVFENKKKKP